MTPLYGLHDFWDGQPVPKTSDTVTAADYDKPIDVIKTPKDVQEECLNLPPGFRWENIDLKDVE